MKAFILSSAHKLFLSRGYDQVSMRNIAEDIEYSPATIYSYFKDKDEIFHALHTEAFKFFNSYVESTLSIADPLEKLFAVGERYMQFASAHPQYYEIMFITASPMRCEANSDEWKEGTETLSTLERIVKECMVAGYFKNQNPTILLFSIWSFMHGMVSLRIKDRMKIYAEDEHDAIQLQSFDFFKRMIATLI